MIQLLSAILLFSLNSSSGTLGLVMNFIMQITTQLNTLVQTRSNLEADFTSTERINMYMALPSESDDEESIIPPTNWPKTPTIEFQHFTMAYKPSLAPCLRDINLTIAAGEHVAVVGRTGAGKSSLLLALLCGVQPDSIHSGRVLIDGLDISRLSRCDVRKSMTLMPQEPPILSGSLRDNIDPLEQSTDEHIIQIMDDFSMQKMFGLSDQVTLDHEVSAFG